ncbi:MAG: HD domain-containing protein [Acidimicrobiia bacterium]|nr:HD domain-containing protein [Acidimicrobiia bacterium]
MGRTEPAPRSRLMDVMWALAAAALFALLLIEVRGELAEILVGVAALAGASQIMVPATSGNRLSLGFAVAAAVPLVMRTPGGAIDLVASGAVFVGGALVSWAIAVLRGEEAVISLAIALRRAVGAGVYATVLRYVAPTLGGWGLDSDAADLIGFTLGSATWFMLEMFLWAFVTFGRRRISRRYLWLLAVKDWMVALSLLATGALFGFAYARIDLWAAVIVVAVPYAFAHLAFHRYQDARTTYWQTIRALSRIPEVAGLSPDGHGDRTSAMAVEVGQRLGLSPDEVEDIRFAAMMHDIGRVTLNEPNVIKMGFTDEDIARWGAEIIAESPYLDRIAHLVRQQHHPYRRPGEFKDLELPMASKVIKATSAYDHATTELGFSHLEALEVLHRGAAYDYDPDVVEALREIADANL